MQKRQVSEYSKSKPLVEQIDELKKKKTLLDGDRKAYKENAEWTMTKNQEKVEQLRRETKDLRQHLQDLLEGDEKILNQAFSGRPVDRAAMKNKPADTAIVVVDQQKSDHVKRLNVLKHENAVKQKKLEELQTQYDQLIKDAEEVVKTDAGESETATKLRTLENQYDKAVLKCNEAMTIQRTYNQIKDHLLRESLTFDNRMKDLEDQILKAKHDLDHLKVMHKDAIVAKENAVNEFSKFENKVYTERKEREICLESKKKEAEQKKSQQERMERRLNQMANTPPDEIDKEITEEEREKISTYEEAFEKIYEETGVSTMQEVVERFKGQGEKGARLEHDKLEAQERIAKLKDERENLMKRFEEMKYSGEQKMSDGQRKIEETEEQLSGEERKRDQARSRMSQTNRLLIQVKSDIDHLANKLSQLKASKSQVASTVISSTSDEYVLDLLSITEEKLIKLYEDLETQGMRELQQQMKEDGVYYANVNTSDAKLPTFNTRITLPAKTQDRVYEDGDESGDEGDEDFRENRNKIKQISKQLVDAKTKRHTTKKNKK